MSRAITADSIKNAVNSLLQDIGITDATRDQFSAIGDKFLTNWQRDPASALAQTRAQLTQLLNTGTSAAGSGYYSDDDDFAGGVDEDVDYSDDVGDVDEYTYKYYDAMAQKVAAAQVDDPQNIVRQHQDSWTAPHSKLPPRTSANLTMLKALTGDDGCACGCSFNPNLRSVAQRDGCGCSAKKSSAATSATASTLMPFMAQRNPQLDRQLAAFNGLNSSGHQIISGSTRASSPRLSSPRASSPRPASPRPSSPRGSSRIMAEPAPTYRPMSPNRASSPPRVIAPVPTAVSLSPERTLRTLAMLDGCGCKGKSKVLPPVTVPKSGVITYRRVPSTGTTLADLAKGDGCGCKAKTPTQLPVGSANSVQLRQLSLNDGCGCKAKATAPTTARATSPSNSVRLLELGLNDGCGCKARPSANRSHVPAYPSGS